MLKADTYWAAYNVLVSRNNPPTLAAPPKPERVPPAEHLDGGCLLYRFRMSTSPHKSAVGPAPMMKGWERLTSTD
jgi:hypothetical protein